MKAEANGVAAAQAPDEVLPARTTGIPLDLANLLAIAEPIVQRLFVQPIVAAIQAGKGSEPEPKRFVTVDEAAAIMGLSSGIVKNLCKERRLSSIRDKRQWMILRSSIEEWRP